MDRTGGQAGSQQAARSTLEETGKPSVIPGVGFANPALFVDPRSSWSPSFSGVESCQIPCLLCHERVIACNLTAATFRQGSLRFWTFQHLRAYVWSYRFLVLFSPSLLMGSSAQENVVVVIVGDGGTSGNHGDIAVGQGRARLRASRSCVGFVRSGSLVPYSFSFLEVAKSGPCGGDAACVLGTDARDEIVDLRVG